jgi:hypothetical protein
MLLGNVTVTQPSPDRSYVDEWPVSPQASAPARTTPPTMPVTINAARRSPDVSGSLGGVLPVLTVGDSFARRRSDDNICSFPGHSRPHLTEWRGGRGVRRGAGQGQRRDSGVPEMVVITHPDQWSAPLRQLLVEGAGCGVRRAPRTADQCAFAVSPQRRNRRRSIHSIRGPI